MDLLSDRENMHSNNGYTEDFKYSAKTANDTNEIGFYGRRIHNSLQQKLLSFNSPRPKAKIIFKAKKKAIKWFTSKYKREARNQIVRNMLKADNTINPIAASAISSHYNVSSSAESNESTEKPIVIEEEEGEEEEEEEDEVEESFSPIPEQKDVSPEKNTNTCNIEQLPSSPSPASLKGNESPLTAATNITSRSPNSKDIDKLYRKTEKDVEGSSPNTKVDSIDFKISETLMEIKVLSEMIKTKELEWNKLLHLRKIKEEIIMHLAKTKHLMELKSEEINESSFSLSNREQLSLYNVDYAASRAVDRLYIPTTALSLVEKRANMKKEDLEKELATINRLQRIVFSENLSTSNHNSPNISKAAYSRGDVNTCSQHPLKDDSSLIADIQQNKMNVNRKRKLNSQLYNNNSPDPNSHTILNRMYRNDDEALEESRIQFMNPTHSLNSKEIPLCQACKSHESRFVCAGCGNQWYCSRNCQVSDWDNHSDICQE